MLIMIMQMVCLLFLSIMRKPNSTFERQLLKENGIFVLEHGKDHDFSEHPHFVEHRQYGSVNFSLFQEGGTREDAVATTGAETPDE